MDPEEITIIFHKCFSVQLKKKFPIHLMHSGVTIHGHCKPVLHSLANLRRTQDPPSRKISLDCVTLNQSAQALNFMMGDAR